MDSGRRSAVNCDNRRCPNEPLILKDTKFLKLPIPCRTIHHVLKTVAHRSGFPDDRCTTERSALWSSMTAYNIEKTIILKKKYCSISNNSWLIQTDNEFYNNPWDYLKDTSSPKTSLVIQSSNTINYSYAHTHTPEHLLCSYSWFRWYTVWPSTDYNIVYYNTGIINTNITVSAYL